MVLVHVANLRESRNRSHTYIKPNCGLKVVLLLNQTQPRFGSCSCTTDKVYEYIESGLTLVIPFKTTSRHGKLS